ncbi:MAG: ribosomal protein S2 [uncultured bacterium]|uniref:Small ribosomal subunit protein uS2 n=1 Tax=Candidatus Giovannonibacteria bacterium GW2011_GWA2_53_7 TaxID=1618650 RepID=A0A0G1XUM2_9BACT|nr:MAG: ribosomal protein S2 [uncultured bacterium]KKW34898.1 MAG: 30S ribosomal protein S2 [Candidatus Giovannonibacteria bacterium GW2011_GWA2_53_7]HBY73070.1 30S ribosomal protein S2 [Candidatus Kerfeldbacteria bacterium]
MSNSTQTVTVQEMLQAGVHFGHKPSKKHPKMNRFVFGTRQGINIIDLERSKEQLDAILPSIEEMAATGKIILFLGTKRQAQAIVKAAAERVGVPYISERWLGGLLTNFGHVGNLMKKLTQLKSERDQGLWQDRYTKKEQLMFEREIEDLTKVVGGVEHMLKLPDVMFVVDCKKEKTAVKEANRMGIPVIAMVDTNVNPEKIAFPIPANDDGVKSISLIVEQVAAAIERGKARIPKVEAPTQ